MMRLERLFVRLGQRCRDLLLWGGKVLPKADKNEIESSGREEGASVSRRPGELR